MLLLFTILFNVLNALADGLYDEGRKTLSGVVMMAYLGGAVLLSLAFLSGLTLSFDYATVSREYISVVISFVLVRYFLFDAVYNITRGLHIFYFGTTKLYDKVLRRLPFMLIVVTKAFAGFLGIVFLM